MITIAAAPRHRDQDQAKHASMPCVQESGQPTSSQNQQSESTSEAESLTTALSATVRSGPSQPTPCASPSSSLPQWWLHLPDSWAVAVSAIPRGTRTGNQAAPPTRNLSFGCGTATQDVELLTAQPALVHQNPRSSELQRISFTLRTFIATQTCRLRAMADFAPSPSKRSIGTPSVLRVDPQRPSLQGARVFVRTDWLDVRGRPNVSAPCAEASPVGTASKTSAKSG